MKSLKITKQDGKSAEFYEISGGRIEVFCMIGRNISRAHAPRSYATMKAADKYAATFLAA
jgi:hypothetical protein